MSHRQLILQYGINKMKFIFTQMYHLIISLFVLTVYSTHCYASLEINIPLETGDELIAEPYTSEGEYLILWFAPEYGFRDTHRSMAEGLSQQGIEVWLSNIQESLFMPNGSSSIKQINGEEIAEMIDYAHKTTGKKIIVAGDSYGSVLALRGVYQWQKKGSENSSVIGAILFSPYTFAFIPTLGESPEYLPIVSSINFPVMIYQAKNSAIISQFESLLDKLRKNDSPIYTRYLKNIMSLFYEPEPTLHMISEARTLPGSIKKMIHVLEKYEFPETSVALIIDDSAKSGIDTQLKSIKGNITPLAINLPNFDNTFFSKTDYKNQVTLINFWATWCPPCIEEIPSLNRLKEKMKGKSFEIISINYAEEKEKIDKFMQQIKIDFPVLLDKDGNYANQWNVVSYPSTFIIDTNGHIAYGVNAAIEWDSDELQQKINLLFK